MLTPSLHRMSGPHCDKKQEFKNYSLQHVHSKPIEYIAGGSLDKLDNMTVGQSVSVLRQILSVLP